MPTNPRLSEPDHAPLPNHAEVVVVGSGYGAAVCAARLAEAGAEVVLLERGREVVAGASQGGFPETLDAFVREVQIDTGPLAGGNPQGLFDLRVGPDLNLLVGCGLGGTSLINAAVVMDPEPAVFQRPPWPREIREEAASRRLVAYFGRARQMLATTSFPVEPRDGIKVPRRFHPLRAEIARAGFEFQPGEVAIHLGADGDNAHGVYQQRCRQCGNCAVGCNYHAKNALPYNYLPLARRHGARLFTGCEVRAVERGGGERYRVRLRRRPGGGDGPVEASLETQVVILGAGVLGSAEILFRSRAHGLPLSPRLGERFSANGDTIAAGYDGRAPIGAVGEVAPRPDGDYDHGPTIVGWIDLRDPSRPLEERVVVEDGTIPGIWADPAAMVQATLAAFQKRGAGEPWSSWLRDRARGLPRFLGLGRRAALDRSIAYLSVGHDSARGRLVVDDKGRPEVRWPGLSEERVFQRIEEVTRAIDEARGAIHIREPVKQRDLGLAPTTVHPLGGCPMADDATAGVVDHRGALFTGDPADSTATHPGLHVVDAALLPTALGVNPLLTIAALAERIAEGLVAGRRSRR